MRIGDDTIETDVKYVGCEIVDWVQLPLDTAQWRAVIKAIL